MQTTGRKGWEVKLQALPIKSKYGPIPEGDGNKLQVSNLSVATSQRKKVLEIFFVSFILI